MITTNQEQDEVYGEEEVYSIVRALEDSDQEYLRTHMVDSEVEDDRTEGILGYLLDNGVVEVLSEDTEGTFLYNSDSVDRSSLERLTERELN